MTTPTPPTASEIRVPTIASAAAVLAVPLVTLLIGLVASLGASGALPLPGSGF